MSFLSLMLAHFSSALCVMSHTAELQLRLDTRAHVRAHTGEQALASECQKMSRQEKLSKISAFFKLWSDQSLFW